MRVEIESIDQRLALNGSQDVVTSLNIRLMDGSTISATVQPDAAEKIIQLSTGPGPIKAPDPREEPPAVEMSEEIFDGGLEPLHDPAVSWKELPEEVLSQQMKALLEQSGTPEVVAQSALVERVEQISQMLLEQAQARAAKPSAPGQVRSIQVPRPKTVPRDEMGYPVVARQADRDPGEIAQAGDEDGIPQL